MGLGLALMENTQFDERKGRVMNPNLAEYHVPAHMDVPEIDVIWTDIPDSHAQMGAHGIGEIGITETGAAVASNIYKAMGNRVRDLPIKLDKLLSSRPEQLAVTFHHAARPDGTQNPVARYVRLSTLWGGHGIFMNGS